MADSPTGSAAVSVAEIALLGTLAGATMSAAANAFLSESHKWFRDRRATAYALTGELASHISAVTDEAQASFQLLADLARSGKFPGLPEFEAFDAVFDKSIGELGLLEGDLPQRVVTVYGRIKAGGERCKV